MGCRCRVSGLGQASQMSPTHLHGRGADRPAGATLCPQPRGRTQAPGLRGRHGG
jgi:hypothetical protein